MDADPDLVRELDQELTYKIPPQKPNDPPTIIKTLKRIRGGIVSIPVGRTDLIPDGYEIKDKRVESPVEFKEFGFTLRESQQEVYDKIRGNAIINAWVSWGKTFTGLALARKLGQKTLVVTHTIPIRSTWVKEHRKAFGFTPGIIGSGKFNIDTPIVIGNTQTLYKNIPQISQEFGTLIVDEVHRVPSKTFSAIVDASYAKNKIGLSGTLERKDGRHVVLRDYFGFDVHKPPKENYMEPSIEIVLTNIRFMDGASIPWAVRVNDLCNNDEYRHLIAAIAAAKAAAGHKVLVVADRVHFLKSCAELVGENALSVTGEVPFEERDKLEWKINHSKKNIVFGTQAIFSEGISVPPLSCLILATPVNNPPLLTQLIGRVIRQHPGKRPPIVVDINLKGDTARRQAAGRLGVYMKEGYKYKTLKA
jgi:superfamily II DNA or RNA helicase